MNAVIPELVTGIQVEQNVPVPMRDGTILRADIYQPNAEGQYPVIIERTQGWRGEGGVHQCAVTGKLLASNGYAYLAQNVRGTYGSEGEFNFGRNNGWGHNRDGFDTIEWAARQPWSNGKVGMTGTCGSGMTQYQAAPTRSPHLKALFVVIGGVQRNYFYRDCVYRLSQHRDMPFWFLLMQLQHETAPPGMDAVRARLEKASQDPDEMRSWYSYLPLKSYPPAEGMGKWFMDVLEYPEDGPYWWGDDVSPKFSEINLPMVHIAGWFDLALGMNLKYFSGIQKHSRSEACRKAQRLIVGPWGHLNVGQRKIGDLDFGPQAEFDLDATRIKWFDYWLKGIHSEFVDGPCVRLFLMGENRWLDMETWPPPNIRYEPLYFHTENATSRTSLNNGSLSLEIPQGAEKPDSFAYDPEDPIPSLASAIDALPVDYQALEDRMLTYTSQVLDEPLTIVGPVKAILYGLSSARDTDWVVRLCDVYPDGRSLPVCDGILRARFRSSFERQELMDPGKIYRFEVDLWSTAQTFLPGHQIRVQVTSSDFPRYDRNLNTGGAFGEEVRGEVALNTIFHDALQPSHILLPILPDDL